MSRQRLVHGAHRSMTDRFFSSWREIARTCWPALLALGGIACSGSDSAPVGSQQDSVSTATIAAVTSAPSGAVTCSSALTATLIYQGSQQIDGTANFAVPLSFKVPSSLPITVGSSKNGKASLAFTTTAGKQVTCTYTLKDAASSFSFTSCDNGDASGTLESATKVVLHIQNADHGVAATPDRISIGLTLGSPDGASCVGTNACFTTYTCQSGACTGSNPVTCTALDQCHAAGTCNPSTGTCSNPAVGNGTACDDGNACQLNETCQDGMCTASSSVTCAALDQCHVAGSCNPATGVCSNPAASDGATCTDGNACSVGDTCQAGTCVSGNPFTCVALDQCHAAGVCDSTTGMCSNPAVPDGTICNDLDDCNLNDTCQAGLCVPQVSFTCADGQVCSALPRACVPATCASLGLNCGPASDGCGDQLNCGSSCPAKQVCGGGGVPGVCGPVPTCTNLCQQQTTCGAGVTTTVSGTVFAPNGIEPIVNALVYVPNGTVAPFAPNVACEQCGDDVSGEPLVSTHSGVDGKFTLENVPVGTNIPVVIQLGRWRRQFKVSSVAACTDTRVPAIQSRLPSTRAEGDIPLIGLVTGQVDSIECVLRKIGIKDSEFTSPSFGGRIHLYEGNGARVSGSLLESALYASQASIDKYDMTILACEGDQYFKTPAQKQILLNYTNAGGRVFATHYSYVWLYDFQPFQSTATWNPLAPIPPSPVPASINTSTPRGQNLAQWLFNIGASTTFGQVMISNGRHDFDAVNASLATELVYTTATGPRLPLEYTFDTPVGVPAAQQCGRVVYSDFHVDEATSAGLTFPAECDNQPLTAQERLLEYMLFDLSSCVSEAPPATCTPRTCAAQGISCGPAGDGCGHPLDCGTCAAPETCGGGGIPGACGNPFCQ